MEGTAYTRNSVTVAAVCIALALTLSACGDVGLGLLHDPSLSEDLKLIVIMCELVDPSRKTAYKTCLRRFGVLRHGRIPPDGLRSALAAGTSSNGTAVIDFLTVRSKTTGKKLPTWTADLPETLTRVGRREIAVSVNITDEEYRSPRGVPKGMTVTLYAVDKKGKREEVGTRSPRAAPGAWCSRTSWPRAATTQSRSTSMAAVSFRACWSTTRQTWARRSRARRPGRLDDPVPPQAQCSSGRGLSSNRASGKRVRFSALLRWLPTRSTSKARRLPESCRNGRWTSLPPASRGAPRRVTSLSG